jgi:hypothetical protein
MHMAISGNAARISSDMRFLNFTSKLNFNYTTIFLTTRYSTQNAALEHAYIIFSQRILQNYTIISTFHLRFTFNMEDGHGLLLNNRLYAMARR